MEGECGCFDFLPFLYLLALLYAAAFPVVFLLGSELSFFI
jgi:hypothetical protein